jgi:SPASM domain peptide maturase of grasp-with-spasm system
LPKIFLRKEKLTGKEMCGVVTPEYFNINIKHYLESLHHNTCLNKKIAIDENGLIRQCPSLSKNYGKVSIQNILKALSDKKYLLFSDIKKDNISICKDCEFRYICTDCRAYITDSRDIYSKPAKCNYDPYTCTWEK